MFLTFYFNIEICERCWTTVGKEILNGKKTHNISKILSDFLEWSEKYNICHWQHSLWLKSRCKFMSDGSAYFLDINKVVAI